MGDRHGDLKRVSLCLIARQYAVSVKTSRRVRDVFLRWNQASGSIDIRWILQSVVETAEFVLVHKPQKVSQFNFRASREVARGVVVAAVLGGRVTVIASSVAQLSVSSHVVV